MTDIGVTNEGIIIEERSWDGEVPEADIWHEYRELYLGFSPSTWQLLSIGHEIGALVICTYPTPSLYNRDAGKIYEMVGE